MWRAEFASPLNASKLKSAEQALQKLLTRQDLGFWQLPGRDENWRVAETAAKKLRRKAKQLVVLGMGGSALGGRALTEGAGNGAAVSFLFNTDPQTVERCLQDKVLLRKAHFLVISKSGNTLEIACLLEILLSCLKRAKRSVSSAITVVTEFTGNPLHNWAKENDIEMVEHPRDVGGRFSAFTPVGLLPAAFAGVKLADVRAGTQAGCKNKKIVTELAAFYLESFARGESISIFWAYIDALSMFGPWLTQLWAESLGKKERDALASTPIAYLGTCDQHSVLQQLMEGARDKSVCFLREMALAKEGRKLTGRTLNGFSFIEKKTLGEIFHTQSLSTEQALREAGRTTFHLQVDHLSASTRAELMMIFELLIGVLGAALNIDAFNQPGVELGKKITKEKLQKSSRL